MIVFLKTNHTTISMNGFLIGRFQPFHLGHLEALHFAITKVDQLWIGLGSSNKSRQKSNPFSTAERTQMILSSVDDFIRDKIDIFPIPDVDNHKKWIELIDDLVPKFDVVFTNDTITRHLYSKQHVDIISIPFVDRDSLSGTHIRNLIACDQKWEHLVPAGTKKFLMNSNAKSILADL